MSTCYTHHAHAMHAPCTRHAHTTRHTPHTRTLTSFLRSTPPEGSTYYLLRMYKLLSTYYILLTILTTRYVLRTTHLDELLEVDAARRVLLHGELALLEIEWQLGREAAQVLGHLHVAWGVACTWRAHGHGMCTWRAHARDAYSKDGVCCAATERVQLSARVHALSLHSPPRT